MKTESELMKELEEVRARKKAHAALNATIRAQKEKNAEKALILNPKLKPIISSLDKGMAANAEEHRADKEARQKAKKQTFTDTRQAKIDNSAWLREAVDKRKNK